MADKKIMSGNYVGNIPVHTVFNDGDTLLDPLGNDLGLGSNVSKPFYLSSSYIGTPQPLETVFMHTMAEKLRFPMNFVGSQFKCMTPPVADTVFSLNKNGNLIGTATFASGEANAVFDVASEVVFDLGDILTVVAPSSLNNIVNLSFNFMGFGLSTAAAGMSTFILEASNITANTFRVSWTPIDSATAYKIYNSGVLVETVNAPNTFYDFIGRSALTSHTITIGVVVGGIEQPQSPQPGLIVITLDSPVAVPTALTVPVIFTDHFRITWSAVAGATAYKVYVNNNTPVVTTNTFFDKRFLSRAGTAPANQYAVNVTSLNGMSESALGAPLIVNTIDLVSVNNVETYVCALTDSSIRLAWRENVWATRYEIQCNTVHVTVPASQLWVDVNGLTANTLYNISVEYWNNDSLLETDVLSTSTLADSNKIKFFAMPLLQSWVPPEGVTTFNIKMWGGSDHSTAPTSRGGYSEITNFPAEPLFIETGYPCYSNGGVPYIDNYYGGGGVGPGGRPGAGRSAVYTQDKRLLLVAGGAGGHTWAGEFGGNGGGLTGGSGSRGATGGTQLAPGSQSGTCVGLGYRGGQGGLYSGGGDGGGGGYFGGGGSSVGGDTKWGGGGGGSGYVKLGYTGLTKEPDTASNADTDKTTADTPTGFGLVVIWW